MEIEATECADCAVLHSDSEQARSDHQAVTSRRDLRVSLFLLEIWWVEFAPRPENLGSIHQLIQFGGFMLTVFNIDRTTQGIVLAIVKPDDTIIRVTVSEEELGNLQSSLNRFNKTLTVLNTK